ncbi:MULTISPECIES: hypothetical protein [Novosphingobium]|uniref:hypothetical protein n=1 Tax=unclassified Novosphingobium TaxID=2644732 RepID=UPI001FB22E6F|nr:MULTISPECIES: hypothetical protein [unclassified Novosphingobium]WRT92390.1 hypothetical protein U9J33_14445 [Novosphingobium sp. RL4]
MLGGDRALLLGVLLAAIAALPALVAWAPQMTDYPSHLAGYKVALDHGQDPYLTRYFVFNWEWTGNLGVELLMVPMAPLFGLEQAGRIIVVMIPFLSGLSIIAVCRSLGRRVDVGPILAFAMIWSPSLLMGFLNYSLSVALGLLAFALWIRLEDRPWRWAVMVPIGFVVWLCHVSGWGVMGVLMFGYEWSRRRNWLDWRPFIKPWPLIFPLFPMLLGVGANSKVSYGRYVLDYKFGILYKAMRSYDYWFDIASVSAVAALLAVAIFRRHFDGRLGWAAVILLVLTLAVPRQIFGGDYADYRLSTTALLVACLAIDWSLPRWAIVAAASLFISRTAVTTVVWYQDAQTARQLIAALDQVPEGARVATAVAIPRVQWRFGPFEHFGSYAVVRRSAMENSNFALPDVHMLSMRDLSYRFADPSQRILYSPRQHIDLRKFAPARHAEYLWYIGRIKPVALPDGARILYSSPNSFLARLADPADIAN